MINTFFNLFILVILFTYVFLAHNTVYNLGIQFHAYSYCMPLNYNSSFTTVPLSPLLSWLQCWVLNPKFLFLFHLLFYFLLCVSCLSENIWYLSVSFWFTSTWQNHFYISVNWCKRQLSYLLVAVQYSNVYPCRIWSNSSVIVHLVCFHILDILL